MPSDKKLTVGILATFALEIVPFCANAPFPVLLPYFKRILDVLSREDVHHCLSFCLDHLSYVKMVAVQFYLQLGKQKCKVGEGQQSC
jgi:hypothetical protein